MIVSPGEPAFATSGFSLRLQSGVKSGKLAALRAKSSRRVHKILAAGSDSGLARIDRAGIIGYIPPP